MRNRIICFLTIILFVCLICNITYAAEANITLQKNKEKYTGGDVVEVSVKINDVTLEKGIETIIGKISYDKDLYESCVIEENNNWEADFNEQNGKIILQRDEAIKENHTAFVIKLKIKDNIVNNDTISFTDINIADENTDLFPKNANTSIIIESIVINEGEVEPGKSNENINTDKGKEETSADNDTNNKSDFQEIKEDSTKTEDNMPKTGVNNIVAIMIAIVAVFGVVGLVKYNKYKGI